MMLFKSRDGGKEGLDWSTEKRVPGKNSTPKPSEQKQENSRLDLLKDSNENLTKLLDLFMETHFPNS